MTPKEIITKLEQASGLNPFENTRRIDVIEVRALLCFILRDKLRMRWIAIKEVFLKHGKKTSNSSLMNSYNNYLKYKESSKSLNDLESQFDFELETVDEISKTQILENRIRILSRKLKNCETQNKENLENIVFRGK
tara:strand:+ start:252 stop:659 length:408 start_codon:yes stop_codon:yes gene_type:complete